MRCIGCTRGFPGECRGGGCVGIADGPDAADTIIAGILGSDDSDNEREGDEEPLRKRRSTKPDAALKDQQSTGRKRAAQLYPIPRKEDPPVPCEWRGKFNMGGGSKPIQGCVDGIQQARHHGPDKNTLNNDEGNVHRICHGCHNRWHSANDPEYNPNKPLKS